MGIGLVEAGRRKGKDRWVKDLVSKVSRCATLHGDLSDLSLAGLQGDFQGLRCWEGIPKCNLSSRCLLIQFCIDRHAWTRERFNTYRKGPVQP